MQMLPWGTPGPVETHEFNFGSFWMCATLGKILTSIESNSHFGKRLGARDMTICVSHLFFPVTENVFSH